MVIGINNKGEMIMKKLYYFVAVATLGLLSCQQEQDPVINNEVKSEPFTIKASIENLATRADMNGSNGLVWSTGDEICLYYPNWGTKHQPFILSSGAGNTNAVFTRENEGDAYQVDATVAFFPWQGTGDDKNNVYNGTMYFKLPDHYDNYTSWQMNTPLVASLSNSTSPIIFKHAGAAVKLTINNLPKDVTQITMRATDTNNEKLQIYGGYSINPANAGTDALQIENAGAIDKNKNTVTLNFANDNTESAFTFIFPVPVLNGARLYFSFPNDDYGVPIWSAKTGYTTAVNLGRAQVLVMPTISSIVQYSQFKKYSTAWSIIGTFTSWADDYNMITDDETFCIYKRTFSEGDEFKIRTGGDWSDSHGIDDVISGKDTICEKGTNDNIKMKVAGDYYVLFNITTKKISIVNTTINYPTTIPQP